MHMAVDEAGQQVFTAKVMNDTRTRRVGCRDNGGDATVANDDRASHRGRIVNAVDDIRVRENDGLGARGHGREQADAEPNPAHNAYPIVATLRGSMKYFTRTSPDCR